MRPSLLDPVFAPASSLPGVGARTAELLARIVPADLEGRDLRILDLLFVAPQAVIDRRNRPGVARAARAEFRKLDRELRLTWIGVT